MCIVHVDRSTVHMLGWGQRTAIRTGIELSAGNVVQVKAWSQECSIGHRMRNLCHFWHQLISFENAFDPLTGRSSLGN